MYLKSTEAAGWTSDRLARRPDGRDDRGSIFERERGRDSRRDRAVRAHLVERAQTRVGLALGMPRHSPAIWQQCCISDPSCSAAPCPRNFRSPITPSSGAGFWIGRLTAIKVIARYLWLTFWPANLSNDYSYSQIPLARGSVQDWIAWMVVLRRARRSRPAVPVEPHRLLLCVLRICDVGSDVEPAVPDRHDHGRSILISPIHRSAGLPGACDLLYRSKTRTGAFRCLWCCA